MLLPLLGFAAASALRLWFSLDVHPPEDFVFSDMLVYHSHANRLRTFLFGPWDTFSPLGYPVLLALIDPTGRHFEIVAVVQALMGGAVCVFAALIAWRLTFSKAAALLTYAASALYIPHIYYGGLILTELPSAFFLTLFFWLLLRVKDSEDRKTLALTGAALSLASIIRPNVVFLYAVLPFYFWAAFGGNRRAAWKALKPLVFASLPLILAACLHNSVLLWRPSGLASNGGLNFFLARAEIRMVNYRKDSFHYSIGPIPNMLRYQKDFQSPVPLYEERFFYKEGLKQILNEPSSLLRSFDNVREGLGLGLQDYWPGWDLPGGKAKKWLRGFSKATFWVILLPVLLGVGWLTARGRILRPEEAPWLLAEFTIAVLIATFYVFLGDPRIHVPFDAILIAFAFAALFRAAKGFARRPARTPSSSPPPPDLGSASVPS